MPIGHYKRNSKHLAQLAEARKKSPIIKADYWKGKKRPTHSDEHKAKLSKSHKGLNTWTKGEKNPMFGKKHTEETREKMSNKWKETHKIRRGAESSGWKGGITPINKQIRQSPEYKLWRIAVFTRDNYTCIWCLRKGGELHADHIKQFAFYPELRFAIDNGRTLCIDCHKTTDTYKNRKKI